MNVLFLTLLDFKSYAEHNIYCDLLREFIKNGNEVFCVSPVERRTGVPTHFEENGHLLKLRIGNTQKTNIIEKGISTVLIELQLKFAIRKYWNKVHFNLVLYSTPPITFEKVVRYIKKRDNAMSYLLLKDIFPQNAVDLGMMRTTGWKSIIYKYFRNKEKKLYAISDRIGCMSQANMDYVIKHNPEVDPRIVEVCPNGIEVVDQTITNEQRDALRAKYDIPLDKKVFVYGGNLGKPQGIPFIIDCLRACQRVSDAFLLIVGDGTEYGKLEQFCESKKPENVKLLKRLPKDEYDSMIAACDVGLIFLDHRFTIPNFPSRLLAYMQAGLPVLAATDPNTDIGKVIVDGGFGWWCESDDSDKFIELLRNASSITTLEKRKELELTYLCHHYSAQKCYQIIIDSICR